MGELRTEPDDPGLVHGLVTFNLNHPIEARIANREWVFLQPAVRDEVEIRLLAMSILNLGIASSEWYRSDRPLRIPEVADAYCRLALRMAGLTQPAAVPRTPAPRRNSRPRT
jgi:hypothetical protein